MSGVINCRQTRHVCVSNAAFLWPLLLSSLLSTSVSSFFSDFGVNCFERQTVVLLHEDCLKASSLTRQEMLFSQHFYLFLLTSWLCEKTRTSLVGGRVCLSMSDNQWHDMTVWHDFSSWCMTKKNEKGDWPLSYLLLPFIVILLFSHETFPFKTLDVSHLFFSQCFCFLSPNAALFWM